MTAQDPELSAALGWPGGISDPVLDRTRLLQMVAALHLASKQALEALDAADTFHRNLPDQRARRLAAMAALRAAPAQQAEPVEPVAWECKAGGLRPLTQRQYDAQTAATKRHYTRIAPPQRSMVPLTEEEIAALVRAEIEALPSYPSAVEELPYRLARAVEKAVWEKNHGQA